MEEIDRLLVNALKLPIGLFVILVESLIERMPDEWKKDKLK